MTFDQAPAPRHLHSAIYFFINIIYIVLSQISLKKGLVPRLIFLLDGFHLGLNVTLRK